MSATLTLDAALAVNHRTQLPLRVVLTGMLIGLLWKHAFFRVADEVYTQIPVQVGFFPALLQSAAVLRTAFIATIACCSLAWLTDDRHVRRAAMVVSQIAATIMLLHQGTYNDMTFTTVWWCNVWSLWYTFRMQVDDDAAFLRKAAFLSRLMLSVVLLGGAMGKWTGEYWSGEVFYEIYFRERDFWVFNWVRATFDTDTLHWIAMAYSRKVIVIETLGGLGLWLLQPRWAAIIGAVIFCSIALLSNFLLFSVLGPLIALSLVGLFAPSR
ncbi:MAG: hypothetical protein WBD20_02515 [Pirellulaceae bacterium]